MKLKLLVGVALIAPVTNAAAQPVQVDINTGSTLTAGSFVKTSSIGWYFTPTSTFFLNAIHTQFNASFGLNADRTVTAELWTKTQATGGALLRSGSFQSNSALGSFGGGGFAQILLQSGIQYFIGFRNISGLGFNHTQDAGAQSLGPYFFSHGPIFLDDQFERVASGGDQADPSIRLVGIQVSAIPEPMTMTLLATGLAAMGGVTVLRRRKQMQS